MTPHDISPFRRRRRTALAAGALAALSLSTAAALAAGPGDIDPSFGEDGRVVLPLSLYPNEVLTQPDGKVILADDESFTVVRTTAAGKLDSSFTEDGKVVLPFATVVGGAALQPDGKLLVAGALDQKQIVVARLRSDGQLDPTFAPGGDDGDGARVYKDLGISSAGAIVVEPAGTIVVAGSERDGYGHAAARLGPSGEVVKAAFERGQDFGGARVAAASLGPGGTIVVAGSRGRSGTADEDVLVTRFTAEGALDKTLGGTGSVQRGPLDRSDVPVDLLVQPDGAIVLPLASGAPGAPPTQTLLTRLRADGEPDAGFGDDGTAIPEFLGNDVPAGVERQPDGMLLLAGTIFSEYDFAIARYTPAGELDRSFGTDGTALVPFADPAGALGASLMPDGRLVVGGIVAVDDLTALRPAIARLHTEVASPVTPPGGGDPGPGADPGPGPGGDPGPGPGGDPGPGLVPPAPTCAGRTATIVGTARGETLHGTRGDDVIVARGGRDTIRARGGRDRVCAGGGRDVLAGGGGADRLAGGRGLDRCRGGAGRDRLTSCEARR